MKFWANLVGYQLVWFAAVIGAGQDSAVPACVAAALFIAWQAIASARRRADLRLVGAALLCGVLIDGGLSASGWAYYATPHPAMPPGGAPLWILALWAAFAMTLNHSMGWLRGRLWLACAFGALGGPLAYWAAARGWQAVTFEPSVVRATAWLAAGWGGALPLLASLARRWSHSPDTAGVAAGDSS